MWRQRRSTPLWKLCDYGDLDLYEVQSALARGEDVNDKDSYGHGVTALMLAIANSHNSIVKLLLDQPGVKVNEKNKSGSTALHYAAFGNNQEGARMLLLHPTMDSANAKTNNGDTAVMTAVRRCYKEVLSEFIKHESVSLDIGNVGEITR